MKKVLLTESEYRKVASVLHNDSITESVQKDQKKIDEYVEHIISKIKKDVDDYQDFAGYREYCFGECRDYPNDVNYHEAVRMVFGELPE